MPGPILPRLLARLGMTPRANRIGPLISFKNQTDLQQGIAESALLTDPYPYFVTENVLSAPMLRDFNKYWPQRSDFVPEIPHTYVTEIIHNRLTDPRKRDFWHNISRTVAREIGAAAAIKFRPWIAARYGADVDVLFARITLMESDPSYAGHGCHTHHYHDPGWIGTLLLYVDEVATGHPGTTIMRYTSNGVEDQAKMAARTLRWHDQSNIVEVKTIDYRQNRLFGFMDSPISYHCVGSAAPDAIGNRRIFRIHLSVPKSAATKPYGVSMKEYRARRRELTDAQQVIGWLANDIAQLEEQSRKVQTFA